MRHVILRVQIEYKFKLQNFDWLPHIETCVSRCTSTFLVLCTLAKHLKFAASDLIRNIQYIGGSSALKGRNKRRRHKCYLGSMRIKRNCILIECLWQCVCSLYLRMKTDHLFVTKAQTIFAVVCLQILKWKSNDTSTHCKESQRKKPS